MFTPKPPNGNVNFGEEEGIGKQGILNKENGGGSDEGAKEWGCGWEIV